MEQTQNKSHPDQASSVQEHVRRTVGFDPGMLHRAPLVAGTYIGPYPVSCPLDDTHQLATDLFVHQDLINSPGPLTLLQWTRTFLDRLSFGHDFACTWSKASAGGMVYPRNRSYPFPIQLFNPPGDTSPLGECYAMELALNYALLRTRKSIIDPWPASTQLYIDNIVKPPTVDPSGNTVWNLGAAGINTFNGTGSLKIQLNQDTFQRGPFNSDVWVGAMDHEILHTLGWEHDDGYNPKCYMIAHEHCASGQLTALNLLLAGKVIAER